MKKCGICFEPVKRNQDWYCSEGCKKKAARLRNSIAAAYSMARPGYLDVVTDFDVYTSGCLESYSES